MKRTLSLHLLLPILLLVVLALVARASGPLCWDKADVSQAAAPSPQERERLLAMGRDLFFQRCGSCHDADGSKPMADGPPLNQRKVSEERVSRVVDSRFKNATEEQRRAVKLHINSFMKR
jgi:mono/diheme cytochrome c family protein